MRGLIRVLIVHARLEATKLVNVCNGCKKQYYIFTHNAGTTISILLLLICTFALRTKSSVLFTSKAVSKDIMSHGKKKKKLQM